MNTAVINFKTEKNIKRQAQSIAADMGLNLSFLINAYLKQLVRTRRVEFDLGEEPTAYLKSIIRNSELNYKRGRVSPAFKKGQDATKWLEKQGA